MEITYSLGLIYFGTTRFEDAYRPALMIKNNFVQILNSDLLIFPRNRIQVKLGIRSRLKPRNSLEKIYNLSVKRQAVIFFHTLFKNLILYLTM